MADYLIKGATIVDGTGAPGVVGDVAVADGKIVAVGAVDETAATTLDADGLVVAPGFVDPHTHYDAQLLWDPLATPSGVHGVTSIIAGNCGFTLAPLRGEADADYTRRMMAKVEGMPLKALEEGVTWDWSSFGEYLGRLEGRIALNAGFLVGHCAIRRYVMGAEATGNAATADQVDAMVRLLDESIEAGGLGFSTTLSNTHSDGDGEPVASRFAERDEILALCAAVGRHEGTTLEAIVNGCLDRFADDEIDLLAAMSAAAQRPLNWNVLTVDSRVPDRVPRQLQASRAAAAAGGRIVALTMPVLVPMNMSFLNYCALNMLPDWGPVLGLPVPERMVALRDPETRRRLEARADSEDAGVFRRLADFANYVIGDTYSADTERYRYRVVADIAAEEGKDPFDTLLDIVLADDLRTILWPMPPDNDPASWTMRREAWDDPDVMLGGSDAGAHLDRMMGASYTTRFLGDCLRGRKLVDLERAVHMLTDAPAQLFGLRGRGRIAAGYHADLVVFDPERIGASNATLVNDLPGGTARLMSEAEGVVRVLVNGTEIVRDNRATDAVPGTVLRSGVDTDTVRTS
ncbi:MAG: amidohydrolase family protein [Acidimicrobiales bacterium]|nr:amidohydrolase family protein [Acidimicrobiales bacterium]MCB1260442.1 amidohydrolase family protein [Acidimicrobiales bacterium]